MRKIFLSADGRPRSGWAILFFFVVAGLLGGAWGWATRGLGLSFKVSGFNSWALLPLSIARLAIGLIATAAGCALVRQPFTAAGFAPRRGGTDFLAGCALGAAMIAAAVLIPVIAGEMTLSRSPVATSEVLVSGVRQLVVLMPGSAAEEVALRGFVLQQLVRGTNRFVAVALTGAIFGVLHLQNPHASWVAAANVALVGWVFGVIVLRTGSLWLAMGLHGTWNWCQGYVWGAPISGIAPTVSVMVATPGQSLGWTGGAFGPEASTVTTVILTVVLVGAILWRRRPELSPAAVAVTTEPAQP